MKAIFDQAIFLIEMKAIFDLAIFLIEMKAIFYPSDDVVFIAFDLAKLVLKQPHQKPGG